MFDQFSSATEAFESTCPHAVSNLSRAAQSHWWSAVCAVLEGSATPTSVSQHLPDALVTSLHGSVQDVEEAWLYTPELTDAIWTACSHCPAELNLLAHLVRVALDGPVAALGQFIGRDLLRLATLTDTLPGGHGWGGPLDALDRVSAVRAFLRSEGVETHGFRDASTGWRIGADLRVQHATRPGRLHRRRPTSRWGRVTPGSVLVVEAGDLYDRQMLLLTDRLDEERLAATELITRLPCILEIPLTPDADAVLSWAS